MNVSATNADTMVFIVVLRMSGDEDDPMSSVAFSIEDHPRHSIATPPLLRREKRSCSIDHEIVRCLSLAHQMVTTSSCSPAPELTMSVPTITLEQYRALAADARAALRMIREVVEQHAPPGSVPSEEMVEPSFVREAEVLVKGILAIAAEK